jgi:Molybdopterin-binding domain of aldehyde dehydrogenase
MPRRSCYPRRPPYSVSRSSGYGGVREVIRALRRASDILPNAEAGTNVLAMREFARGDIGAEMTAAPMRVGGRFRFHRKTPLAIENRACLADYDRGRRSLTLTPCRRRSRASFATFSPISSTCRDTACASSQRTWAVASAARHNCTRRRSSLRCSPAASVGRCAGPVTGWRILPRQNLAANRN